MDSLIVLAVYLGFIAGIPFFLRRENTKEDYLAGNRKFGTWSMALSVASTWIWAPALFVSAEKAYSNGIPGLFWFLVPNVLCLLIFIPIAKRIREQMSNGFTLSEYMEHRYSPRVKTVYLFQLSALSLFSTVVQLLAGGKILSLLTGLPFWLMTILLGLFTYSYSFTHGIRASVITDAVQMVMMIGACFLLAPWAIHLKGFSSLISGLSGVSHQYGSLFDAKGLEVLLSFGIPAAIGLLSGPFGDQGFWQRAFSVKKEKIGASFALGAVLFAIVPLMMGILGFVAAGIGMKAQNPQVVNLELVSSLFPRWALWIFLFMLLSGLLSTVSSNLCSISSLVGDLREKAGLKDYRLSMLLLTLVSIGLANLPGLTIDRLFLFYGTLRASTFATTVLTLLGVRLSEKGVFFGVLSSLLVGWPIFAYGNLVDNSTLKVIGSLTTLLLSGIVAFLLSNVGGNRFARKETSDLQ